MNSNKRERRFFQREVRVAGDDKNPKISGIAAVFNSRSKDLGFIEVIDPSAFDECLANQPDIIGLYNHDNNMVLGRTTSGSMRVWRDDVGLRYEIDPPATSYANDLMVSMNRGDVRSSSFGFFCTSDEWTQDPETGKSLRTILKANVFDCSVVTNPAYEAASSQLRSLCFPDGAPSVPDAEEDAKRYRAMMKLKLDSLRITARHTR